MAKYSTTMWRNCATCEFWQGPRDVNEPMHASEVDERACGPCKLVYKNAKRYATNSCARWRGWMALHV